MRLGISFPDMLILSLMVLKFRKLTIINYLCDHNLIPVKRTTAYKIESYVSLGVIPQDTTWTEMSKHGRKALLTPTEMMYLIVPMSIPDTTLNGFVNRIKAQCVFNLFDNVANKTESRAIAEWSIRSTLAFTAVVAANHFIPLKEPSLYHPKKKDLNKNALLLWNLVEYSYNKMLGHSVVVQKMYPVLPNLLTTTDEVTIFATAGDIYKKRQFLFSNKT